MAGVTNRDGFNSIFSIQFQFQFQQIPIISIQFQFQFQQIQIFSIQFQFQFQIISIPTPIPIPGISIPIPILKLTITWSFLHIIWKVYFFLYIWLISLWFFLRYVTLYHFEGWIIFVKFDIDNNHMVLGITAMAGRPSQVQISAMPSATFTALPPFKVPVYTHSLFQGKRSHINTNICNVIRYISSESLDC